MPDNILNRSSKQSKEKTDRHATLVVGAGIEGMGIALLLAEAGHPVYLLDNMPWIGGSMHLLDRTFPTDSCGICLMAPVQPAYCPTLECNLHRNITVLPHTEVSGIEGEAGAWQIALQRQPRYVIEEKCTRCGLCLEACPESRPSLYEEDLACQKAIYRPPSRAVPNAPVIDMDYCTRCGKCVEICPVEAIDLDEKGTSETIQVAAIVLCPGYQAFDARLKGEYGYGIYDNVVTSLQFERMTSASGSTAGHILRPSDGRKPQRIAFIQCVGSRDKTVSREYCSSVCCMYTAKQVAAAKESAPDLEIDVFHIDLRAGGKGYEEYLNAVQGLSGVTYRRSMISSLIENQQDKTLRLAYIGADGKLVESEFDMVVLSVGLAPAGGMNHLAGQLGMRGNDFGFYASQDTPGRLAASGVFAGGTYRQPMDVPEVVVDAAQVAGQVAGFLVSLQEKGEHTAGPAGVTPEESHVVRRDLRDEPARIGLFLHQTNTSGFASSPEGNSLLQYATDLPGVLTVQQVSGPISELAEIVETAVMDEKLNRCVIASDISLVYRTPFSSTLSRLGLPPDAVEWVNWQDGCLLVHEEYPELREIKARQMLAMAVGRASESRLLRWPDNPSGETVEPHALVIGGGPSGMAAALGLARQGYPVHLVEKAAQLGGQLPQIHSLLSGENSADILSQFKAQIESSERIQCHTNAQVVRMEGRGGRFITTLERDGEVFQIEHGAVIVATGRLPVVPHSYGYGEFAGVMTQRELEQRISDNPEDLRNVKRVVMVQCVESRDDIRPYCSRICCSQAVKNALTIKRQSPETEVYVLYRDVRTPGFEELAYQGARQAGVIFLRYETTDKPVVDQAGNGALQIEVEEPILERKILLDADWIVLSVGVEGQSDEMARVLGVPLDANGFFEEAHPKMRPLDFARPGLYVCGLAHGPCSLPESIAQGEAAAMRAAVYLSQGVLQTSETGVAVNTRLCSGCGLCVSECPYGARFLDPETGYAGVIEALCLGCGACAVVCRNNATQQHGYEKARVISALEAALD